MPVKSRSIQKRTEPDSRCAFTFVDGRRCRMPRAAAHPRLCPYHAHKETQALAGAQVGQDIAQYLSGAYVSANDLAAALGRLFSAVAQGHLKPQTASTLAYLGQTLVQTIHLAQHEYINAFGTDSWRRTIRSSFSPPAPPAPPVPSSGCSGRSSDRPPSHQPSLPATDAPSLGAQHGCALSRSTHRVS